jgi:hypothetical protein
MTKLLKYSLSDFSNITFDGFDFSLPEQTISLISELSLEVGSPTYIKTPIFKKRDHNLKSIADRENFLNNGSSYNKNKRKNKNIEFVSDNDWENIRKFQATKIEEKEGLEGDINIIRSHLNKISDKNFTDIKEKIISLINKLIENGISNDEMNNVSIAIFEIASTNRFYSKLYADLYSELIDNYEIMKTVFENSFNSFLDLFNAIEYVDPDVNYDQFCKNNKVNERRRSFSTFFVNLMNNKIITQEQLLNIIENLITQLLNYIKEDNKKNEVDEITENIAILCTKEIMDVENCKINDMTISENIKMLANSKAKSFPSLSHKSIFKFMDMIEM